MHLGQAPLQKTVTHEKGDFIQRMIDLSQINLNAVIVSETAPQILAEIVYSMDVRPLPIGEPDTNTNLGLFH